MKELVLISIIVFLSGCSSSPMNSQGSSNLNDKMFRHAMNMGCILKYGNKQRCICNTQVLFDAAGPELRAKFVADPQQHQVELFTLMIKNDAKLDECKIMATSENTEAL
jgi:hypothetical protein